MIYPLHTSPYTSTIESAEYENRTFGAVRGRRLNTPPTRFLTKSEDLCMAGMNFSILGLNQKNMRKNQRNDKVK